ncbi:MAG TPA: hypothetical protein VE987_09160 [Polyangiaceae bacterium]|nr:hypothetical protein [Polyangiaceae bacterium]
MSPRKTALVAPFLCVAIAVGCRPKVLDLTSPDGGTTAGVTSPAGLPLIRPQGGDKLDLLFAIGNQPGMADKQELLAQAAVDLMRRLVTPNCVGADGTVVGTSAGDGTCAVGAPEFAPVHDMHVGIVTSSLGGRSGNQCPATDVSPVDGTLNAHEDDQGHLVNRGGADEHAIAAAAPNDFLSWFPATAANAGRPAPPNPETVLGAAGQPGTLIGDLTDMIRGVHEHGCVFSAPNEAWYRFLVQPDPFTEIGRDPVFGNSATLDGYDDVILQQRAAFLRPDSILAVIVVTDRDEAVVNPLSVGGEGWLFEAYPWPHSPSGGAPQGTTPCAASGPGDPGCTSCAFTSVMNSGSFATLCPNDPPLGAFGYLDPSDDAIGVRFFNQKQRFGVSPGYPLSRYTRGLTSPTVPDRAHEVDAEGNYVGDADAHANCVNPVFAASLPTSSADPSALSSLQRGPRTPDMVFYGAIAGVPHQLLQAAPGSPECPGATSAADCPQRATLAADDWRFITGSDPEHDDFDGVDFHMLASIASRDRGNPSPHEGRTANSSTCPPQSPFDDCDPLNGREWDTGKADLQFACIFHYEDPTTGRETPKDCTSPAFSGACDCAAGSVSQDSPLCARSGTTHTTDQIFGKAYPSIRSLAIAHAMATSAAGNQAIVSSVCPIHTHGAGGDPTDPLYGYRPAMNAIVDRIESTLAAPTPRTCLAQSLTVDGRSGQVPCEVVAAFPARGDGEAFCDNAALGLSVPPPTLVDRFRQATAAPASEPICQLHQISTVDVDYAACAGGVLNVPVVGEPGWCYGSGPELGACDPAILFTPDEPPAGAVLSLVCTGP